MKQLSKSMQIFLYIPPKWETSPTASCSLLCEEAEKTEPQDGIKINRTKRLYSIFTSLIKTGVVWYLYSLLYSIHFQQERLFQFVKKIVMNLTLKPQSNLLWVWANDRSSPERQNMDKKPKIKKLQEEWSLKHRQITGLEGMNNNWKKDPV